MGRGHQRGAALWLSAAVGDGGEPGPGGGQARGATSLAQNRARHFGDKPNGFGQATSEPQGNLRAGGLGGFFPAVKAPTAHAEPPAFHLLCISLIF